MTKEVNSLARFTLKELEEEVFKRKAKKNKFCFISLDDEFEDDSPSEVKWPHFGLVKKTYWNKYKKLEDKYLGDEEIDLIGEFYQVSESVYEFVGEKEQALKLFKLSGIEEVAKEDVI